MGGLAAALAASRAGWQARLYEEAPAFSEVGAGLQLGPNATRILRGWGLLDALRAHAAFPQRLLVRDAASGGQLGLLRLGERCEARYGAPYATIHRADLHGLLLHGAQAAGSLLHLGTRVASVAQGSGAVQACVEDGRELEADALAVADGLWSGLRTQLLGDGTPRPTGHVAYRGLVRQADLPPALRSSDVTAWLGPRLHLVAYPVRRGEWLNVACFVEGRLGGAGGDAGASNWDNAAVAADLQQAMGSTCAVLGDLVQAVPAWRLWVLHGREPVGSADEMARGRIALLGDAAHPMPPYLAQGAAMAIEDAEALGSVLGAAGDGVMDVETALRRYALSRWQRCARVQRRSIRNGRIFHARGPLRWGRDAGMAVLGERLLDVPWLYR